MKYLGVQLEPDPGASLSIGDARSEAVRTKVILVLVCCHSLRCAGFLSPATCKDCKLKESWRGSSPWTVLPPRWPGGGRCSIDSRNYIRSEAFTLGLLAPLHRMSPVVVQCWSTFLALARLLARSVLLGQGLWRACFQERRCRDFARQVRRCLYFLKWQWTSWDKLTDSFGHHLQLQDLAQRNARGDKPKTRLQRAAASILVATLGFVSHLSWRHPCWN